MHAKVYMSNISPLWTFERQESLLEKAKAAGYTDMDIRRDELSVNERRAHKLESLTERHILLRGSTRKDGGMVIFPTLASVTWANDDLMVVLARLAELNARVWVLDQDLHIPARNARTQWRKAAEAFLASRQRNQTLERGKAGGLESAKKRAERLKNAIDQARQLWGQDGLTMHQIAERCGASVSGLVAALGPRRMAQKNHQAALKRKARSKSAQREADNAGN